MIRPANAFMVSAMVIAGIWFSNPVFVWWRYILAAIVPIAYIGIAMVHNDIIDYEIDLINAPNRPLPSGRVTEHQAIIYCWILFAIGTVAGIWLGLEPVIIMALTLILSLLYNTKLKKIGFLGNLAVGITATSAFLYGDAVAAGWEHFWPAQDWSPAIYLFLISSVLNTAREVAKGIMDVSGDEQYDVRTIAVLYGKQNAAYLVVALLSLAFIIAVIPLVNQTFGYVFIIAVLAFLALLVRTGLPLVKDPNYTHAKSFKNNLLPSMFLALVLVIVDIVIQKYTTIY